MPAMASITGREFQEAAAGGASLNPAGGVRTIFSLAPDGLCPDTRGILP